MTYFLLVEYCLTEKLLEFSLNYLFLMIVTSLSVDILQLCRAIESFFFSKYYDVFKLYILFWRHKINSK